jgi:hypothetical protein
LIKNYEALAETKAAYTLRLGLIESGELSQKTRSLRSEIGADAVFDAIENAAKKERWIDIFIFVLLFTGLQLTIIKAAEDEKEIEKAPRKRTRRRVPKSNPIPGLYHHQSLILKDPVIKPADVERIVRETWPAGMVKNNGHDQKVFLQVVQILQALELIDTQRKVKKDLTHALKAIKEVTKK